MPVLLERAYDTPSLDGYRVLVDRLWPRGLSKERLQADEWLKDVAPSNELRKAYHRGDLSWGQFRSRYLGELKAHRKRLRPLASRACGQRVVLLYSASDRKRNNAVVLRQYLRMLMPPQAASGPEDADDQSAGEGDQ